MYYVYIYVCIYIYIYIYIYIHFGAAVGGARSAARTRSVSCVASAYIILLYTIIILYLPYEIKLYHIMQYYII